MVTIDKRVVEPPEIAQLNLSDYYQPHTGQQEMHRSQAKRKVLRIARRWGKSRWALWEMIRRFVEALETPADASLVPPWHAWVVCPSYPQARQVWNELITFLPNELLWPGGIHQDERMIYLRGNDNRGYGLIEVKSAHDPDSLQTAGLDYLWVSEAQDVSDRAFEKMMPMLTSPGRTGYAVYEGIPALYATHWFERNFRVAQLDETGLAACFTATAFDNPYLTEEHAAEIENARELLPERAWRRMYLAEFSEDAGYFSNITPCISGDLLTGPLPGAKYVAGMDIGRKVDPSVVFVMDAQDRKVVFHYAWDQGADWISQREGVTRICRDWGVTRLILDATGMGGDMFTTQLEEMSLPVEPYIIGSQAARDGLLQGLVMALERQTISFPSIPQTLRQLRAFQYRRMPSGRFRAEAPEGEHDDEVFALALALTACDESHGVIAHRNIGRESRYVPTQNEADQGIVRTDSIGSRTMRDRRLERTRERQKEAGII
jgi:hypothetical protein